VKRLQVRRPEVNVEVELVERSTGSEQTGIGSHWDHRAGRSDEEVLVRRDVVGAGGKGPDCRQPARQEQDEDEPAHSFSPLRCVRRGERNVWHKRGQANITFEPLDVLYVPSRDVEADLNFYRDLLGARLVFAIEAMGTG
jgi:hypothetical protein